MVYIPLRLVRKFFFGPRLLRLLADVLPFYAVSQNEITPIPIVDQYINLLKNNRIEWNNKAVLEIGSGATNSVGYNKHFEQIISNSIFAVGGLTSFFIRYRLKKWLENVKGVILDVGCGDQKWKKLFTDDQYYIPIDYVPAATSSPWRTVQPLINADVHPLPIKDNCVDGVLNVFMLEHVANPGQAIKEMCRVLKPGGYLLLVGPGDILLSHGEPYNYYNMTRFAYGQLLKDNDMDIYEKYYPGKFFVSFFSLLYGKIVRHDVYNKNGCLKLLQLAVLLVSMAVSPIVNIAALLLDSVIPFDQRGYMSFMVLARKNNVRPMCTDNKI